MNKQNILFYILIASFIFHLHIHANIYYNAACSFMDHWVEIYNILSHSFHDN